MSLPLISLLWAMCGPSAAHAQATLDPGIKPIKFSFGESDEQWVRLQTWHQAWARANQNNPGTTVQGNPSDWTNDIILRRSRVLLLAQLSPRVHLVSHFGINNQNFNNTRKPGLFLHDAYGDIELIPKALAVGAGLHYWNGTSRLASASTISFLGLDAPLFNWPAFDNTDQFARQLGVFAKGKLGKLDYRVALNRPFSVSVGPVPEGPAAWNPEADRFQTSGYFMLQLDEHEPNVVPFTTGSWLGQKSVFNIGVGATYAPDALATMKTNGELSPTPFLSTGLDIFVDQPTGKGAAITTYLLWSHLTMGPDHLKIAGVANVGTCADTDGDTVPDCPTLGGGGNGYPAWGTGEILYSQVGYLLPGKAKGLRIQPYGSAQVSFLQAVPAPLSVLEAGINWLVLGHQAKVTTHYQARPLLRRGSTEPAGHAHQAIAQLQVAL